MSYVLNSSKRTLATFVSRKTEMKLRIYPKYIQEYQSFLDTLPEKVKKEIKKASVCKRLINPDDCNPKCVMGYTFVLDGEQYQKAGDEPAVVCLLWVGYIVNDVTDCLAFGTAFANVQRHDACGCHDRILPP